MDELGEQFAAEPEELSSRRLRRFMLILGFLIVAVAALVVLVPGLESLRDSFSGAKPGWLAIAAGLEVLSWLSYVIVFRGVFCARSRWVTSYEIGTAELATNSVLSVGGAGGLALGAGILRRGGMPAVQIARRRAGSLPYTALGVLRRDTPSPTTRATGCASIEPWQGACEETLPIAEQGEAMKQTHVAGGPPGVARIDRPHSAGAGHTGPRLGRVVAAVSRVGQLLLAALVVETLGVALFGVVVGTVVAVLEAAALLVGLRLASHAVKNE
jgi:hypothetical protein